MWILISVFHSACKFISIAGKLQVKARIFLLVDLRELFSDIGLRDAKKKSSENDQLTDHFQSFSCFLFFFVVLISFFLYILPDPLVSIIGRCTLYTVQKVNSKTSKVNQKSVFNL